MMTDLQTRQFAAAYSQHEAGHHREALKQLDDLAKELPDGEDKAGLLYHEVLWLVGLADLSVARSRLSEMKGLVASVSFAANSVIDTRNPNSKLSLKIMAQFAEAKLLMEEGDQRSALELLEDLTTKYPEALSAAEMQALTNEAQALRGIIRANLDLFAEAKPFLEQGIFPPGWEGLIAYYLGHCHYELQEFASAEKKLTEAVGTNLPQKWACRAHYILGIVEYKLAKFDKAKNEFDLCLRTSSPEYLGTTKIWEWLEATSRALGLAADAEDYRRRRTLQLGSKAN
jgi:tetratricopeptide (TPR) repeat protein